MDVATIICDYIYGTFTVVKELIDALVKIYELMIEKLYSVCITLNNVLYGTIGKGLETIVATVTTTINSLVAALNLPSASWSFCADAYRCKFFLEQVLDPNSLIATAIRKVLEGKDDCYCRARNGAVKDIQQTLYDIVYDYENFKTQICNGLSLDLANDMLIDLMTSYLGKLNKWRRRIERKIRMLRKYALSLLDTYRKSDLFELLGKLESFFDCVIDSDLCANVDTAKSYYQSVLVKLKLRKTKQSDRTLVDYAEDFALDPEFEDQLVGVANSFLVKTKKAIKKVQSAIGLSSSISSTKGASNAIDLTTSIRGIVRAVKGGMDATKIPLIDYTDKKIADLYDAYCRYHGKNTEDSSSALSRNKCFTVDDVILGTRAEGDYTECLVVEPGTDTSHAQDLLNVGGKFYTVAEAARQLYTGTGDSELIEFCKTAGNVMDIRNLAVRY